MGRGKIRVSLVDEEGLNSSEAYVNQGRGYKTQCFLVLTVIFSLLFL